MINRLKDRLTATTRVGVSGFLFGQSPRYYKILTVVSLLVVVGLIMVLSSSATDSIRAGNNGFTVFLSQGRSAILGVVGMVVASQLSFSWVRRQIPLFFGVAIFLQLVTLAFGTSIGGNKNWLKLGPVTIQPSEILKLAIILFLADYLAKNKDQLDFSYTWRFPTFISSVAIGTVLWGRDLGTGLVMGFIMVGVLLFAGLPRVWFWRITAVSVLGVVGMLQIGGSRIGRINAWLHPDWPDPNDYNWQQDHAMWAFASGGWTGVGLGKSQLKWSWIPEAENDFIFAIIGEEGGLIFSLLLVAMFVALTYLLVFAAENNSDQFSSFLIQGLMVWIAIQASVNIAVVLDWLPVLGVPLPLISAGGS